jgi:hypothetical protein
MNKETISVEQELKHRTNQDLHETLSLVRLFAQEAWEQKTAEYWNQRAAEIHGELTRRVNADKAGA